MPVEIPDPSQLLVAAKDARGKITPLPQIKQENSGALLDAFNKRFDFLGLVDSYSNIPESKLGGRAPQDKLKEESLSAHTASSIYEVVMVASYPKETTHLPSNFQADIPAMMKTIPPFLRGLSLGGELQTLLAPRYRLDIEGLVAKGPETVRAEYDVIVERLNKVSQQKDLQPEQRLSVARDVISLLTLVSHPQTMNVIQDIMIKPAKKGEEQIPLSSVAASYLTVYRLGEEMGKMLAGKESIPVRVVESSSVLPTVKPAFAGVESAPFVNLISISEKIARGEGVTLDKDVLAQFKGGFVEVKTGETKHLVDDKHFSERGASIIEQFRRNFCSPVENTIPEKSLRTPENIKKQAIFYARIELLLLGTIKDPAEAGIYAEDAQHVIDAYRTAVLEGRSDQPITLQNVVENNVSVEVVLQKLAQELVKAPGRSFGVAEYLLAQYQAAHDPYLEQFLIAMNELATNAGARQKIGFDQIIRLLN